MMIMIQLILILRTQAIMIFIFLFLNKKKIQFHDAQGRAVVRGHDGGAGEAGTGAEPDQEDLSDALLRRFPEVRLELERHGVSDN